MHTGGSRTQGFVIHLGVVRSAITEHLLESVEGQHWLPWVRGIFEAGHDVPSEQAAQLVVWLAAGYGDRLTGRFLNVADDVRQFWRGRQTSSGRTSTPYACVSPQPDRCRGADGEHAGAFSQQCIPALDAKQRKERTMGEQSGWQLSVAQT